MFSRNPCPVCGGYIFIHYFDGSGDRRENFDGCDYPAIDFATDQMQRILVSCEKQDDYTDGVHDVCLNCMTAFSFTTEEVDCFEDGCYDAKNKVCRICGMTEDCKINKEENERGDDA